MDDLTTVCLTIIICTFIIAAAAMSIARDTK